MSYKDFFTKHVNKIKKEKIVCAECKTRLKGTVREVAHVLPKSYFKSIAKNDKNIIYLCEKHHTEFDNRSNDFIKTMKIFPLIAKKFKELLEEITETINYKTYNRYE